MRPAVLLRLALAGNRTDLARVVLTALSAVLATVAGLAALTVLAIPTMPGARHENNSEQYSNALLREPGLRGGVALSLLLLTVPVLALAGQCARLGAPARDRRFAALRLAGATPGQVTALAVLETGLAALLGTLVGLGAYLTGHALLDRPDAEGRLALPTDVLPATVAMVVLVLGLPLVAAGLAAFLLRRVVTTPFGVVRRSTRERAPGPWAGVLILGGLVAFAATEPVTDWFVDHGRQPPLLLGPLLLVGGGLGATAGVVVGTGWLSHTAGRLLHRYVPGPAALLAARRLTSDPWAGSRTLAALLAAVMVGGGAAGLRAYFTAQAEVDRLTDAGSGDGGSFYLRSIDLVDLAVYVAMAIAAGGLIVALVEGVVARRRSYAALVATGVPRGTLGRSIAWQALAPAVPAVGLALAVGLQLSQGIGGRTATGGGYSTVVCAAPSGSCADGEPMRAVWVPEVTIHPGVPVGQLALFGAGALAAVLVTVGVGLLFLRTSTEVEELRTG